MAEISGVPTADIDNVDGFFTTQGGGLSPNSMPASGVNGTVRVGNGTFPTNPLVTLDYNIGATANHTFTKVAMRGDNPGSIIALKANGTLWYNMAAGSNYASWSTNDGTWRQYGTDTDWTDITGARQCFGAVKGGALMFNGNGSYRQRGDGSTSGANGWIVTNSTLTWSKISYGYYLAVACTTSGEAYFCGYNWEYMTGQGTTSGSMTTYTRDQFNTTGVTFVSAGFYRHTKLLASGNMYSTGRNSYNFSGPLITSTAAVNGPLLSYNGGDLVFVSQATYWNCFAINSAGQLLFAGSTNTNARPDNVNSAQYGAAAFGAIDNGSTGWTFYQVFQWASASTGPCVAIKNGQAMLGGGNLSWAIKEALGYSANNTNWVNLGSSGATSVFTGINYDTSEAVVVLSY